MDQTFEGEYGEGGQLERRSTRAFGGEHDVNVGFVERIIDVAVGGALVVAGLRKRSLGGILLAAGGGFLAYRGATGYCPIYGRAGIDTTGAGRQKGIVVHRAITIDRPIEEVYRYWRDFKNMPRFMGFIDSVEERGDGLTHWRGRFGRFEAEWDVRVTDEQPNRCLAWRATEDARIPNDGIVELVPAPGGQGTEVHLRLRFQPPGREIAQVLAPLFRMTTKQKVAADLSRLKQILETGEGAMRRETTGYGAGARTPGGFGSTTSYGSESGGLGGGTSRVPGEGGTYGGGTEIGTGGGVSGAGGTKKKDDKGKDFPG